MIFQHLSDRLAQDSREVVDEFRTAMRAKGLPAAAIDDAAARLEALNHQTIRAMQGTLLTFSTGDAVDA